MEKPGYYDMSLLFIKVKGPPDLLQCWCFYSPLRKVPGFITESSNIFNYLLGPSYHGTTPETLGKQG